MNAELKLDDLIAVPANAPAAGPAKVLIYGDLKAYANKVLAAVNTEGGWRAGEKQAGMFLTIRKEEVGAKAKVITIYSSKTKGNSALFTNCEAIAE